MAETVTSAGFERSAARSFRLSNLLRSEATQERAALRMIDIPTISRPRNVCMPLPVHN